MTEGQRRAAVKKLIKEHTAKSVVSKKTARDTLIREGIYTQKGKLRAKFGGVPAIVGSTYADDYDIHKRGRR